MPLGERLRIHIAIDEGTYAPELVSAIRNEAPSNIDIEVMHPLRESVSEILRSAAFISISFFFGKKLLGPSLDVVGEYLADVVRRILRIRKQEQPLTVAVVVNKIAVVTRLKAEDFIRAETREEFFENLKAMIESELANFEQLNAESVMLDYSTDSHAFTPVELRPVNFLEAKIWYEWDDGANTWKRKTLGGKT